MNVLYAGRNGMDEDLLVLRHYLSMSGSDRPLKVSALRSLASLEEKLGELDLACAEATRLSEERDLACAEATRLAEENAGLLQMVREAEEAASEAERTLESVKMVMGYVP